MRDSYLIVAWLLAMTLAVEPAVAQQGPNNAEQTSPKPRPGLEKPSADREPTPEEFEEAQRRYTRAIELFNEGSYDASLLEFRRSYQLAPSYKILYNVALVNVQLNDYAQALDYFERYLEEGGSDVPELRTAEVKAEIERLSARVAKVHVTANVTGAQVSVDDLFIGNTPLQKPLRVNAGRRKVTVAAKGRVPINRVVELAGGDSISLEFDLRPPGVETRETTRIIERREKSFPWAAWAGTAVLAVGAGVTGVFALQANGDLEDEKNEFDPGVSEAEKQQKLEDLRDKRKNFALATDVLAGAALIAGGISVYLTVTSSERESVRRAPQPRRVEVGFTPGSVNLRGTF